MSIAEEDTELRDLVAQTLDKNGILGKIKAQLRASIFLALEEVDSSKNLPSINAELREFSGTENGRYAISIIEDFLDHFDLDFTKAVFEPECCQNTRKENTLDVCRCLNINEDEKANSPILSQMITKLRTSNVSNNHNRNQDLTDDHLRQAKERFDFYDQDKSGTVDKEKVRCLLIDLFPGFGGSLIDRFVSDEFRLSNRDFSSSIDITEFIRMYRRLYERCLSVVCHDSKDAAASRLQTSSGSHTPVNNKSLLEEINDKRVHRAADLQGVRDSFFDDMFGDFVADRNYSSTKQSNDLKPAVAPKPSTNKSSKDVNYKPKTNDEHPDTSRQSSLEYVPTEDDYSSAADSNKHVKDKDETKDDSVIEDISAACDELLRSQSSIADVDDDFTTDQTISQHNDGFDYGEEPQPF